MGAATSVENSFNVKYMKPLLWEYEASKAVMEPNKARKNIVDFLTSGKYPFSEEQMVKIKSAYGSCEAEIREKEQVFHQHWQKIVVEEGGSAFRTHTHTRDTGDSRGGAMGMLGMEMDGPMGVGGLIGMDIGVTQDHTVSETAPAPAVDDHEAMQMVNSTCDRLQFANQLPAYMESVSGDPLIIQIGLKMSDRLKLLEKYEEDWADLLQTSEVVEAQCKDIVAECLQELSLSLAKEQSEEQEEGDEVCTDITWGVSLKFLKDFLAAHPEIDADYTTGSVVYNIIIPETAAAQETYVRAHLLRQPEQHKHLSDLRGGFRRVVVPPQQRGMGMAPDECGLFAFLSHAWSMSFRKLVEIADLAAETALANKISSSGSPSWSDKRDASCFFWLDVFCKNQHKPAPAMEEFRASILAPAKCVVAMSPVRALAVTRIWCLYEVWTASILPGVQILPTYPRGEYEALMGSTLALLERKGKGDGEGAAVAVTADDLFRTLSRAVHDELQVDICQATATRPEDIGTIMDMIREQNEDGVEALNKVIEDVIAAALFDRLKVTHNVYNL